MQKFSCSIFFLFLISLNSTGQKDPTDKQIMDSLLKNDELMRMLDSLDQPTSYIKLNVGIGNQLFSVNNKALDALQSESKLIFIPSVGYFHKSGLGILFAAYLLNENSSTKFYQYAITPSYEYETGKDISASVSYTRFITTDKYNGAASPIQNDIYASLHLKRPWIKPGIAAGFSNGKYKEINMVTVVLPNLGPRTFLDTTTTKLNSFSLIGSLQHTFEFYDLLNDKDGLDLTPAFMVNTGSSKYEETHQNIYSSRPQNRNTRLKRKQTADETGFQLVSFGLNLDLIYTIGRFSFAPQLYLDYYLPQTDAKRFTQFYMINFSFAF